MNDPHNNESLSKYNTLSATFFFECCLKLDKNRKDCVLDQIEKYNVMIKDDKTREDFQKIANVYLKKTMD
jgi:hypothetical protein